MFYAGEALDIYKVLELTKGSLKKQKVEADGPNSRDSEKVPVAAAN